MSDLRSWSTGFNFGLIIQYSWSGQLLWKITRNCCDVFAGKLENCGLFKCTYFCHISLMKSMTNSDRNLVMTTICEYPTQTIFHVTRTVFLKLFLVKAHFGCLKCLTAYLLNRVMTQGSDAPNFFTNSRLVDCRNIFNWAFKPCSCTFLNRRLVH